MHRTVVMLTLALVVGVAVGMLGNELLLAQQAPVTRTMLQQKDLEGVAGREVVMYRAEAVPGFVGGRHYHSGPEFVYILDGALIVESDGQPPVTLKAGESAHLPAKDRHGVKNGSSTAPVKLIVFIVGEKGQPLATPVQ